MNFSSHFIFVGFLAFLLTFALTFLAVKFFPRLGLVDRPHRYGLKRAPIPYYGGLALFTGFMVSVFLFVPVIDRALIGVLVGLVLLVFVSFLDDLLFLNPFLRLFIQFFAAGIVVYSGVGIRSITNPFGGFLSLDQFSFSLGGHEILLFGAIFTVIWIVLMVNSMNFLDGVSGLVSGVTFLASVTFFLLSIRQGHVVDQTSITLLSVILAGGSLAFFLFDFPRPKILMGDTGSVMCGFLIAVMAIFAGGKIATAFLVMGFPLLDAIFTVVRRIAKKQSPWKGDLHHLHHRMLAAGFSERQVVLMICLISAVFGGVALFLGSEQKLIALIVLGLLMASVLLWLLFLKKKKNS